VRDKEWDWQRHESVHEQGMNKRKNECGSDDKQMNGESVSVNESTGNKLVITTIRHEKDVVGWQR
jgi:hypothetical protein